METSSSSKVERGHGSPGVGEPPLKLPEEEALPPSWLVQAPAPATTRALPAAAPAPRNSRRDREEEDPFPPVAGWEVRDSVLWQVPPIHWR